MAQLAGMSFKSVDDAKGPWFASHGQSVNQRPKEKRRSQLWPGRISRVDVLSLYVRREATAAGVLLGFLGLGVLA